MVKNYIFLFSHEKILIFFFVLVGLVSALFLANYALLKILSVPAITASKTISNNFQKSSAYECGFDPFDDARSIFFVHFYVVALLFLVFDIEVVYMLPWAGAIAFITPTGLIAMVLFLVILTIGFIYEIKQNTLSWV